MSRQIHQNRPITDAHGRNRLPTARNSLAAGRRNLANGNGPVANGNGPIANGNGPNSKCRLVNIPLSEALESTLWRQRPRHLGE